MDNEEKKPGVICSVFGCHSYYNSPGVKSMHIYPAKGESKVDIINKFGQKEKVDRHVAWKIRLKQGKNVSSTMRVCSLHFSDRNYMPRVPGKNYKRFKLKMDAVPDQNLPKTPIHGSVRKRTPIKRCKRELHFNEEQEEQEIQDLLCDKEFLKHVEVFNKEDRGNGNKNDNDNENVSRENERDIVLPEPAVISPNGNIIDLTPEIPKYQEKEIQVEMSAFVASITTDKKLNTFTGIQSFKMLDAIVEAAKKVRSTKTNKFKLSFRDRIILTCIKLKQNCSFVMISCLFGKITSVTCKNIFVDTIIVLSVVLKCLIPWPSYESIQRLMPACFLDFRNVRVVLDCTEVFVQKRKCLQCRMKVYSQYKGGSTVKFMTAVSPDGQITYVSQPYGGRASDKLIFEKSKLIAKLEPFRGEVMVDKGFLIEDICSSYGITLIRPPFMTPGKAQFTKEETFLTRGIAKARVHVERANQRIKIFKIFSGKYDWSLLEVIGHSFQVVCGLVNVSSPILADKRFPSLAKN